VENSSPLAEMDAMLTAFCQPFTSPTCYIVWQMYQVASQQGAQVIFDGLDGDTAVHHGDAYLAELARAGQWNQFFALAKALTKRRGFVNVSYFFQRYAEPHLHSLAHHGRWRQLGREVKALSRYSRVSRKRLFYEVGVRPLLKGYKSGFARTLGRPNQFLQPKVQLINEGLLRRTHLIERATTQYAYTQPANRVQTTARQEHYSMLDAPIVSYVFELNAVVSQTFGLDARHPFADRRVLEFCYSLPPQQKINDGWTRYIVRRALEGVMPDAIRWRGGKTQNSAAVTKAFRTNDSHCLDAIFHSDLDAVADYIDIARLRSIAQRYYNTGDQSDEMQVWQAAGLALWLRMANVAR
jgi:asparagine synthase (glutamine-hydrolysing)